MSRLREVVKDHENELKDGIAWVVFWKDGRAWGSQYLYLDVGSETIDPNDLWRLEQIREVDPGAVALNGYYCGRLGEDMNTDQLTAGVRWHYENGYNTLAEFMEAHTALMPPELMEEARQIAHAAGLPFSEKPYRGEDFDPYSYDGSMTPEDYELMHTMIAQERSEKMSETISIKIDSHSHFEIGELGGQWLTLPSTTEQLHAAMERVGITADNPQDFFISGLETPIEAVTRLYFDTLEMTALDELNYLATELSHLDPNEVEALNAAGEVLDYWDSVHQLLEYAHNKEFHVLIPGVFSPVQLGEYYLNQSEMIQIPDEWAAAIDTQKLGELAAEHEKGQFTEHGYLLQSGDEWEAVSEVPEQYRIVNFPQPSHPDTDKVDFDTISTRQTATLTTEPPQKPIIPLVLNAEKPAEKLKEITDRLEQGISEIFESDRYKEYLSVMSKFHNYSFNNTLLIAMQKPDASHIAGFNSWKNEFGRNVRKGEKGIKIIAPSPFKVKKEMDKIDPTTQRPVMGKDGKTVTEEREVTIPAFKVVAVFDVSQTEGKELPDIAVDALTGDVESYKEFFVALEKTAPVPVAFEKMDSGTHGYYHLEDKRIAIAEGMSELQTLKTTIHEIAHAKLHDIDLNAPISEQQSRPDRRTREVEAESIAYTVCQHYGLDTSDYSFGYVAGWSSGKELAELKSSLETIRSTAAELINTIDGHIAEMQKEQTAEQEQTAPEQPAAADQEPTTFSIYQLKGGEETRDFRFEPYERLQASGLTLDPANYELSYNAPFEKGMSLEGIFEKFNLDRPADFTGHSLSVSDVVVLHQDGQDTAHYVDIREEKAKDTTHDTEQQADATTPDSFLTGEMVHTPRGNFHLTAMTQQEMEAAGYGFHHQSDDGKYFIMGNGTRAFAIMNEAAQKAAEVTPLENPLAAAEMSTEQNYNMIDGVINNTPTVDELEAKVKAGEQISLTDLAAAIKTDKQRGGAAKEKPSIRAQLKESKEKAAPKKAAKTKNQDLEV